MKMSAPTRHLLSRAPFLLLSIALLAALGSAQTETILFNFSFSGGGAYPQSTLVLDGAGNLYGTTSQGGTFGAGVVFEMVRGSSGWTEKILYNFSGSPDAGTPYGGLVQDTKGNLYGVTAKGGTLNLGAIYKLSPLGGGSWKFAILHSFAGGLGGGVPSFWFPTALTIDTVGNLYGTTVYGGTHPYGGLVFRLAPNTNGVWTYSVLYDFTGGLDGSYPVGRSLTLDSTGNLYGATYNGGTSGVGVAYKLTPTPSGPWTQTVLHSFTGGADGAFPNGGFVIDASGSLYGTTQAGGSQSACFPGCGVIFKLSPSVNGTWTETVLHTFTGGEAPYANLISDAAGNFYGTTFAYGGTVYKLARTGTGKWTETVLYTFGSLNDGMQPYATVVRDAAGNLYGTTPYGGTNYAGIVYEITP
jgi:uncharacterized repeat protein (TIGR03803 family)